MCGESVEEFLKIIEDIKKENPQFTDLKLETENESDYYDSYYAKLIIYGYRILSKQEQEDAAKEAYDNYVDMEKRRYKQYLEMKKKYGD